MPLNELNDYSENIQKHSNEYLKTSIDFYKLKFFKILMQSISLSVKLILFVLLFGLFVFFGSIALAFFIGNYFNSIFLGFAIVSLFYLFLFFLLFLFKKTIIEFLIIRKFSSIFFTEK